MKEKGNEVFEKISGKLVRILFWIFIIVFSVCVLAEKVPDMKYVTSALESLEKSQDRVLVFSGATLTASTAISFLPSDSATPLANTLAEMNKYLVFILGVIFFEKILVVTGIDISFTYIIPAACILYIIFELLPKEILKKWAAKVMLLGIALVCAIPFSIHFSEKISVEYVEYVDETIAETNTGAEKINNLREENETFTEKAANILSGAIQGVKNIFTQFNKLIRKCMTSIAIMLVSTFVLPIFILLFFQWLLKELFKLNINIRIPKIKIPASSKNESKVLDEKNDD